MSESESESEETRRVQAANDAFYTAFERLDAEAMDVCWARGVPVSCVHPGWDAIVGRDAVMASWRDIFGATQEMSFTIELSRVLVAGDAAWVVCRKTLRSVVRGQSVRATLVATNMFVRADGGQWRIVHHHASPLVEPRRDCEGGDDEPGGSGAGSGGGGPRTLH